MNEETFVTSAKLDEESGVLNIYFNDSFYLSTNLGSGIEVGFINALVNTYGYNYNVDKLLFMLKVNSTKINEALCQWLLSCNSRVRN